MDGGRTKKGVDKAYLASLEKQLRGKMNTLKMIQNALKEHDSPEIEVSGKTMMENGLKRLDTFLVSCRKELGVP
jgi:hypothetical protein